MVIHLYITLHSLKLLLSNEEIEIDKVNKEGEPALHTGVGHFRITQLLLSHGADIHKTDHEGRGIFQKALNSIKSDNLIVASHKIEDMTLKLSLNKKANANQRDNHGNTSLHHAARTNNENFFKQIFSNTEIDIDKVNKEDETAQLAGYDHIKTFELLINHCFDNCKIDYEPDILSKIIFKILLVVMEHQGIKL
ncbi:hypothetical protein ILUMI_14903 [Ignelater luminosus]|uniref:Ankyrin repeat protein n=1 Tax=Ignelater luminosus TaxID=2038154 RepID=A0A8K0G4E4_IGNLU|nr:hypothetical protein ILUMI_14903 [Ignelater luminosus]